MRALDEALAHILLNGHARPELLLLPRRAAQRASSRAQAAVMSASGPVRPALGRAARLAASCGAAGLLVARSWPRTLLAGVNWLSGQPE